MAAVSLSLLADRAYAQGQGAGPAVDYSISNEFRYGIGERYEQEKPFRKEYLENLFNTRVYVGDFTLGFRAQIDKPREYGRDTIGIKEYFAEFKRDGLSARGGTFYQLVGQGLVFNTFESRPIGFDAQTEGIKLGYDMPEFSATAYGGILSYADILSTTRIEEYLVRGAGGEARPLREVSVGGSYLTASGLAPKGGPGFRRPFDAYLREMYVKGNYEGFNAIVNYADKRTQLDSLTRIATTSPGTGNAWYSMLGYQGQTFGLTAQYKDYRFDLVTPDMQQVSTRETRALPFQNPPTLVPEYGKTLMDRNPHAVDFSDEVGMQFEALLYPTDQMTVTLIGAAASRHNAWNPVFISDTSDPSGETGTTGYQRINDQPSAFPELSDVRYSPYWEISAHGEYEVNDDMTFGLALQRRDNRLYREGNGRSTASHSEDYTASTLMLESETALNDRDNLHAILELQDVFDSKKETPGSDSLGIAPNDGKYNNVLLTLEFSRSPRWSVNGRLEWTTTDTEQGGKRLWPAIGATYRIGNSHTIGIQYGAERAGVVCTGGVCRLVNSFEGFRLSIVSKL